MTVLIDAIQIGMWLLKIIYTFYGCRLFIVVTSFWKY